MGTVQAQMLAYSFIGEMLLGCVRKDEENEKERKSLMNIKLPIITVRGSHQHPVAHELVRAASFYTEAHD